MDNFQELMTHNINIALEPNKYLEEIKKEVDKEKIFKLLKKYFVENITKSLYQNMDLINMMKKTDNINNQYDKIHQIISKNLFVHILLAVNSLVNARCVYHLEIDNQTIIEECYIDDENLSEYSICENIINNIIH